jgi:ATP-dependent DNA helicase RecQ
MPQISKKPVKKAKLRPSSASAKTKRTLAKPLPVAVKRSATAPREAALKAKAPLKARKAAELAQAKRPRKLLRKAPLALVAKPKPSDTKVEARIRHAVILPPKPKRVSARLLVARAPRAARMTDGLPEASESLPTSASATRATVKPAGAKLRAARLPTLVAPALPRMPRARITQETWRALEAMASRLGRAPLNDEQRVAIRAALEGHDSLVVLADDERAVSCYQLPAFQLSQPTVVVSPVPAELRAQYDALNAQQSAVVSLSSELGGPERSAALSRIARGGPLLVLLNPEALRAPDIRQALAKSGIALFVVEEAHCASDASHELRPSFAELGVTLRGLGSPPIMALTRVATAAVRRDIRERLGLEAPVTIQSLPVPDNVQIVTKLARGEGRQAALVRLVERLTLPGLVFCATPHDVDSVYSALCGVGISAHRHHAGMTAAERAAELANFRLPGQRSVMVAVSAFAPGSGLPGIGEQAEANLGFGRGSAKRDLRFVVHYQSPASLEQYLREIQRAGADGLPATCVLLHESSHRSLHEVMLAQQRFRATHLAELGRALETPALEGRTVSLESLALGTGQSRRTTDRLTALLADAGVVSRAAGWVRVLCSASELDEACRRLGAQLYALREQDARRLAAVSAFAEAAECKLSCLSQYLGEGASDCCGRCNACVSELLAPSQESLVPPVSARRGVVHEFSVQPLSAPQSAVVPSAAHHGLLPAKLVDFGVSGNGPRE